ncbi:HK97 gp10 family phage protein [Lactobacillus crispatus]|uniref:HK97 gp10 family phage protein n=1 Tax=Lactobacillus crispatus TaxID=47770 RepID=UPI001E3ED446|nr:HK97 gp10 family phage protein [Lactobacillus crispatus]
MASFEKQLNDYRKQLTKLVPNTEQKRKANKAGAEVYQKRLAEVTKAKHYSNKKDEKYGHMADHIEISDKNSDGVADGSATVGWQNRYHAMNAMRLNDGTVHIKADHFVDLTREESNDAVVAAQAKALGFKKGG